MSFKTDTHSYPARQWVWWKMFYAVILAVVLLLCLVAASSVHAEEVAASSWLSIKPNRCVALHEGQDCYQTIVIRWHTAKTGHYCLVEDQLRQELKCWENSSAGTVKYEFQSNKTISFSLLKLPERSSIAHSEMMVAWVYKARKRQRLNWRLF